MKQDVGWREILAPLAAAGLVATGCAFYPSALFCAPLPWSQGAGQAAHEASLIRNWARWDGLPQPLERGQP